MSSFFSQLSTAATPVFFLLLALMVKLFLVTSYLIVIYFVVKIARRTLGEKMGVQAKYYSWYALLLSFPLSAASWNSGFKLTIYELLYFEQTAVPIRILVFIWFAICTVLCAREIVLHRQTKKAIKGTCSFSDPHGLVQRAADLVHLRAGHIQVVKADFIRSAASYGVFKKTILLPADYSSRYSEAELYLLILHEMVHLKNWDTIKLYVLSFAKCWLWILPLFRSQFLQDTEILCDNRVMGLKASERDTYGELLVRECSVKNKMHSVAFSNSYHTIRNRLEALYDYPPERQRFLLMVGLLFFVLLATFVWSCFNPADWLEISAQNNQGLELYVLVNDPVIGEGVPVIPGYVGALAQHQNADGFDLMGLYTTESPAPSEVALFTNTYEITNGQIQIDRPALYEALTHLEEQNLSILGVQFNTSTFNLNMPQMTASDFDSIGYQLQELENSDERYLISPVKKRGLALYLYLIAAHWL